MILLSLLLYMLGIFCNETEKILERPKQILSACWFQGIKTTVVCGCCLPRVPHIFLCREVLHQILSTFVNQIGAFQLERFRGLGTSKRMFLIVAITNDHILRGLKQHKFIILQFWRSEVQREFHWAKIFVSAVLLPFWRQKGRICSLAFLSPVYIS